MKSGLKGLRSRGYAFLTAAVAGFAVFASSSFACSADGKEGFLPSNELKITVKRQVLDHRGIPLNGGINEAEFNGVITAVEKIYRPIAKAMGGNLVFTRDWADTSANAGYSRDGENWFISLLGGLARHPEMTIDGFLLVVCHEVGHQIGGFPKYDGEANWASNEGQSDYFATLKCARRVLKNEPNLRQLHEIDAPDSVRIACRSSFQDPNQAAICVRTQMAGLALGKLFASLAREVSPNFDTPDLSQVGQTYHSYPNAQCRLDTSVAGAVCSKNFQENVSDTDPTVATCSQEKGDRIGFRPRCWYAPENG